MTVDYQKLGFLCGLELHQQRSGKKLFCDCATDLKEAKKLFEIKRKLRASAGELGQTDAAAAFEQLRDKEFLYTGFENEACLIEADEEPPQPISQEHLTQTLALARFLKMDIPNTLFVMRKIVTDGSACSSFQRTMLVGLESNESFLETTHGNVKITQLNLEEDSCKVLQREGKTTSYSLSRQGIPLWEIGTDASIKNPHHALEVAKQLGMIFRSFQGVKRGLGSVRQDINVSIRGGERVEVKGWQDLKTLPLLIENEVLRQKNLLEIKEELSQRGVKDIKEEPYEVTELFTSTQSKLLQNLLKEGAKIYSLKLPHFAGLLKKELCPGKTFGKELAEYGNTYGTKGMIHTDEDLAKYDLTKEFDELCKKIKSNLGDLVLIIAEKEEIAKKAINAIKERAKYALIGIPKETRVPNHVNATSSFARPLPGAGRMYPESDLPSVTITKELLSTPLPELLNDKINRLAKSYILNKDLVAEALKEGLELENYFTAFKKLKPGFILTVLLETPKEIKTRFNLDSDKLTDQHFEEVLKLLSEEKIQKEAVLDVLMEIIKTDRIDLTKYQQIDEKDLEKEIKLIIHQNKGAPFNALMGEIMKKFKGKADSKKIVEFIKKHQ